MSRGWLLVVLVLLGGCRKDEQACPDSPRGVDWRDRFVGRYDVYDTLGTYRYAMEILKSNIPDSLYVVNWGNAFDVYVAHDDTDPTPFFNFAVYNPAYDRLGNRWSVAGQYDETFDSNYLINDTLRMSYFISNIAFYAEDGVPFFEWSYREYGVKQ